MAKEKTSTGGGDPLKSPVDDILDLTIAANEMAAPGTNAYGMRNDLILQQKKDELCYVKGRTVSGSAKVLLADARRKRAGHSAVLADNIVAATRKARPDDVAAHHIVAAGDRRAFRAQTRLFGWGIAINDADNGVFLPRNRKSVVPGLPDATKHSVLHTDRYYFEVYGRLRLVDVEDRRGGRLELRGIKRELIAGEFPFRKDMR
jgi:hypothetical protein